MAGNIHFKIHPFAASEPQTEQLFLSLCPFSLCQDLALFIPWAAVTENRFPDPLETRGDWCPEI